MEVRETFDAFVRDFGGELVGKLFMNPASKPQNTDDFFGNHFIVARLECMEKDYSASPKVGEGANRLI